jgi:hypothetical protein
VERGEISVAEAMAESDNTVFVQLAADVLRYQWVRQMFPFPEVRVVHISEDLPQAPEDHPEFWNIWRRGWILPIIAVGLWGFVSIVIGTIYPAGVQRFSVSPNEFQSEERYLARNIEATRAAFGHFCDSRATPLPREWL